MLWQPESMTKTVLPCFQKPVVMKILNSSISSAKVLTKKHFFNCLTSKVTFSSVLFSFTLATNDLTSHCNLFLEQVLLNPASYKIVNRTYFHFGNDRAYTRGCPFKTIATNSSSLTASPTCQLVLIFFCASLVLSYVLRRQFRRLDCSSINACSRGLLSFSRRFYL